MSEDESRGDEMMVPIIIVGNKSDNKQGRRIESAEVLADWLDSGKAVDYIETSASKFENIESLFKKIAEHAYDYQNNLEE